MFTEWEYKLLTAKTQLDPLCDEAGNQYGRINKATLNALGKDGWEVCACHFVGMNNYFSTMIVKRKRSTQS